MAAKKAGGLGKGLDTLIPGSAAAPKKKQTSQTDETKQGTAKKEF